MAPIEAAVAIPAPIIPYGGMSAKQSAMLISAAIPETTQLNCVKRARPIPIATTV